MSIKTYNVSSLPELLKTVLAIAKGGDPDRQLWYRGVSCDKYTLLPKLLRDGKNTDDVFEREKRLLTRFRQRSIPYWPAGYPQDNWEQLFAMQHHGLPTRLLDWSENLLVAAYFALASADKHAHDCHPVVWCIDPVAWNRAMPGLSEFGDGIHILATSDAELDPYFPGVDRKRQRSPVTIYGAHNSGRIVAQRGAFLVWGNDARSLQEVANDQQKTPLLWQLSIAGERTEHLGALRAIGVSETMLFPELTSLASEINRTEAWRR